jgi:hypothetical protein
MKCDFAETYSIILQAESHGFHLKNAQATVRFSATYLRESHLEELLHASLIIISDSSNDGTVVLHLF